MFKLIDKDFDDIKSKIGKELVNLIKEITIKEFELKKLPQKVEELEAKMAEFDEKVADPSFYQQDGEKVKEFLAEREALQAQIDTLYQRWEELETIKEEGQ